MNNLQIINGIMEPYFDADVFEYNVTVSSDVISLLFDYTLENENVKITIYGNDCLNEGDNHVLLEVFDKTLKTYTFNVFKESEKTAATIELPTKMEVSIKSQILSDILVPLIAIICFFSIVTLFFIVFKKKKIN